MRLDELLKIEANKFVASEWLGGIHLDGQPTLMELRQGWMEDDGSVHLDFAFTPTSVASLSRVKCIRVWNDRGALRAVDCQDTEVAPPQVLLPGTTIEITFHISPSDWGEV